MPLCNRTRVNSKTISANLNEMKPGTHRPEMKKNKSIVPELFTIKCTSTRCKLKFEQMAQ